MRAALELVLGLLPYHPSYGRPTDLKERLSRSPDQAIQTPTKHLLYYTVSRIENVQYCRLCCGEDWWTGSRPSPGRAAAAWPDRDAARSDPTTDTSSTSRAGGPAFSVSFRKPPTFKKRPMDLQSKGCIAVEDLNEVNDQSVEPIN